MKAVEVKESVEHHTDLKGWVVFLLLAFIWGASFILIKKGLIHFNPLEVGALRVFLSAIAFLPVWLFSKIHYPWKQARVIIMTVFLGNGLPAVLFALAETKLGSAVTGILNSLSPIFAMLLAIFFFHEKFKRHYLLGLFFGCLGIALLVAGEKDWRISFYVFFVVFATFCYGLSANLIKKFGGKIHPVAFTSIGFMTLGIPAGLILAGSGAFAKFGDLQVWKESLLPLLTLALVCTVIANVLFYWLIIRTNAIFSSAIAYAIPCMALVWGSLDGEIITWFQLVGFVFILSAVYTLRRK